MWYIPLWKTQLFDRHASLRYIIFRPESSFFAPSIVYECGKTARPQQWFCTFSTGLSTDVQRVCFRNVTEFPVILPFPTTLTYIPPEPPKVYIIYYSSFCRIPGKNQESLKKVTTQWYRKYRSRTETKKTAHFFVRKIISFRIRALFFWFDCTVSPQWSKKEVLPLMIFANHFEAAPGA